MHCCTRDIGQHGTRWNSERGGKLLSRAGTAPSVHEMIAILRDIVPDARTSAGGGEIKHPGGIDMPRKGALNSARAAAIFGYSPRYDLRAGLEVYIRDKRQALARERRHEG